jgi:molecular chaperone HscB
VHFCPQCTRILTLGRHGDYFAFLGVPRKLNLDLADLEQRFRTMSRQFHPDYFHNASLAERRASLERSSYLNDAYRTLKHPIDRIEYLLSLEGADRQSARGASGGQEVPASLLEEVFALNEELDEVRDLKSRGAPEQDWKSRLERAREPIDAKQAQHEAELRELSTQWDALADDAAASERRAVIEALRGRMLERNYISNLLAGIEKEMAQGL